MKKALLFEKEKNQKVKCSLCAHRCLISEGHAGVCRVRLNKGGELFSLNFDKVAATHLDPIEKKPLYHFFPGSSSYSLAAMGCNFSCAFCQNYTLSQVSDIRYITGNSISPAELVAAAQEYRSASISYTYSEPTVFFELMLETARLAKAKAMGNVMVTNGYMTPEALAMLAPFLDAANIDLKAFSDDFYKRHCGARLQPVLETIRGMHERGIWIELTTLLIPGLNMDLEQMKRLIDFILGIDPCIPWHVSRFFPQYKMLDHAVTPLETIFAILEMAEVMGLKHIYSGNTGDARFSDTNCPNCKQKVIARSGYHIKVVGLDGSRCSHCGQALAGRWP